MESLRQEIKEEINKLFQLIQNTSLTQFNGYCAVDDFEMTNIDSKKTRLHAHWISFILVASKPLKITFKTHYAIEDVKQIVSKCINRKVEEISDEQVTDFMKEFCNLCAGNVKKHLLNCVEMGISLPLIARGFDEIFMPSEKENLFKDYWKLHSKTFSVAVICSTDIEVMDAETIRKMQFDFNSATESDEIDFF